MNNLQAEIEECINHMQIDFAPLHDIFRTITNNFSDNPKTREFIKTLEVLDILLTKNSVYCLEGPKMILTKKSKNELLHHLEQEYLNGRYEEINYAFWFGIKGR